jgi:hypothetical protein
MMKNSGGRLCFIKCEERLDLLNVPNTNQLHPVRYVVAFDYTSVAEVTETRRMVEQLVNTEFKIKWKGYVQAYSLADLLYRHFSGGSEETNEILSIDNRFLRRVLNAGPPS